MNNTAEEAIMDESSPNGFLMEFFRQMDKEDATWFNTHLPSIRLRNWSDIMPGDVPPPNTPVSTQTEDDECIIKGEVPEVPKPYDGPDPVMEKLNRMTQHLKKRKGQVSKFQYDLERYEYLRDLAFEDQNFHELKIHCSDVNLGHPMKPYLAEMYHELMTILNMPNYLEIEMYADLINKCCAFGSIMETWLDSILEPWFDGNAEIIAGPIINTNLLSSRMVWEMDKINIVLERVRGMINCTISEVTDVQVEIIEREISQEVEHLVKTFLWLTLKDQKRYEKFTVEFDIDEKIHSMSYIDQHPTSLEYCTNVIRCIIPGEIEAYLSCHFADGMAPEIDPIAIRSRAFCSQSRAAKYTATLNQLWTFVEESNVKIDTHKISSDYKLPTQASAYVYEDTDSPTLTELIWEAAEMDSFSSTETPVVPSTSSVSILKNAEDTHVEPVCDTKEDSLLEPSKQQGAIRKFFLLVGSAITKIFRRKNSVDVQS